VGLGDACLKQGIAIKSHSSDSSSIEVWAKPAEGFTILVDDCDRMSSGFKLESQTRTNTTTTHDDYMHWETLSR
jgi:hypothetical protein